jgi:hypothetical protein
MNEGIIPLGAKFAMSQMAAKVENKLQSKVKFNDLDV